MSADPVAVTGIVMAVTAIITAATPIAMARSKKARDEKIQAGVDWRTLNEALYREIDRLQKALDLQRADCTRELDSQRAEYQSRLDAQRAEYQSQLDEAHKRISDLEGEVSALQRLLDRRPDGPAP